MNTQSTDEPADGHSHLRLLDALVIWGDQRLVEAVKILQAPLSTSFLTQVALPRLARPDEPPPPAHTSVVLPHMLVSEAWQELERSFRAAIETGALHLEGVEANGEMDREPQAIRGAFAAEMKFDFQLNTVWVRRKKFLSVTVSRTPSARPSIGLPGASPQSAATLPSTISTLADEQILDLLSEYVRRVTESPDPKMVARIKDVLQPISDRMTTEQVPDLAPEVVATLLERHAEHVRTGLRVNLAEPGKASALALAASMLRHRARTNQLRPDMAEEAEWLSAWVTKVAPSYASLGTKRLQNALGALYRNLRDEYKAGAESLTGDAVSQ